MTKFIALLTTAVLLNTNEIKDINIESIEYD